MEGVSQGNELRQGQPFGSDLRGNIEFVQNCRHLVLDRLIFADNPLEVVPETLAAMGKASPDEAKELLLVKGLGG